MKIVIGSIQCEGNTLTPVLTRYDDFDKAFGNDMLGRIHVVDMLKDRNAVIVPTLYAHALPGGPVNKKDFLKLVNQLVSSIPKSGIDGVWLYLHGAMYVEEIESGDAFILKKVRDKVGYDVPISVGMDFHANNSDTVFKLANVICGFKTAPHIDRIETERRAMKLLFDCIDKHVLPKPQYARANVCIAGDAVLTSEQPLKDIMKAAEEMEKLPGMMCVQVFNGQPWVDTPYMGPNMVVTHQDNDSLAKKCADVLAQMYYDRRHDFKFLIDAVEPSAAIDLAEKETSGPVFISDSGDNTTAGAAGDNAFMLNRLIESGFDHLLLAGIMDRKAVDACYSETIGSELDLTVGGSLDAHSEKARIHGKLIHVGDILSYTGGNAGRSATLDCGKITVILTENRAAITSEEIFQSIDLDITVYKVIVVKLGYLFPGLQKIARKSILAFTPGSSTERLQDMNMKNIRRPMYPLDDDFLG